jgi:glycosyltransferase involved in cell wall biosynthesis
MNRIATSPVKRVAIISQGLGRIVPPNAEGSIAIWTYEVAKQLSRPASVLLVEFGTERFMFTRLRHEEISYLYVPTVINRIVNAAHKRLSGLMQRLWPAERRITRPIFASVFYNLGYAFQAAWHAKRWGADVIHIHNFSQFVPVVRALNPAARIILHMNCEWLSQLDPKMIAPRIALADVVIGCSGHIVGRIVERFPAFAPKCRVVFNGCDVEQFVPSRDAVTADPPEPLRILFVGRISPEKGPHVLVEAFKIVAAQFPTARLELVGAPGSLRADFLVALSHEPHVRELEAFYDGDDYLAEIKNRIPKDLAKRVTFYGNLPQRSLKTHYERATIFVNSSFSDAFPLPVVEAMAAGIPVVASAVGGIPEAVSNEITGLLVKPNSPEALAAALNRLLADSGLRGLMGAAARRRALELFSWSAIAEQVADVYGARIKHDSMGIEKQPAPIA